MTLEDPERDHLGQAHELLDGEVRGVHRGVVGLEALLVESGGHDAIETRMDRERHARLGQVREQRLVTRIVQVRDPGEELGPPPHAAQAELLDAAARLGECVGRIDQRQRADAEQSVRRGAAVVREPVVHRAAQRERRLALDHALDHQSVRRIHRGAFDRVERHVVEPRAGQSAALGRTALALGSLRGAGPFPAPCVRGRLARNAHALGAREDAEADAVVAHEAEVVAEIERARGVGAEARGHLLPDVGRLDGVAVRVEDPGTRHGAHRGGIVRRQARGRGPRRAARAGARRDGMLDLLIRGGLVVDGTGAPARRADVGIRAGRIASLGPSDEPARARVEADGLVVAPGFVDPHTHYDCQLHWDPLATPSSLHGVTSVIAGNCGFTIAPLVARDVDYVRRMMAGVEGMPLAALEAGLRWDWSSFGEWLGGFDGKLALNAGFLVGHCALRRCVLGEESGREATPAEVARMLELLRCSLSEGGLGLSTSRSYTHRDGDGDPVPSRAASVGELLELCAELRQHEGTSLEFITSGCLDGFSPDEVDLMARMSLAANRPLNWNVLTVDSREAERCASQLAACEQAARRGARVVALSMPVIVGLTMSFESYSPIWHLPDWGAVLERPAAERMAALRDPATRRRLAARANAPEAGVFLRFTDWAGYRIGETFAPANAGLTGRYVRDIAAQRGVEPFDALLDVVLADELRTVLWPHPRDDDEASWALRARVWQNEHVLLGGSDAGAHLDRMCGAPYATQFLADCLRGRKLMSLERAVQALTDAPARLFGLRGRGRVAEGWAADLVLLDPERLGCRELRAANDLPGGAGRLIADPLGVERVLVNGRAVAQD